MPTINLQVAASADDARQGGAGTVSITGTTMSVGATGEWAGVRFNNVTIPQGATISSATASFYVTTTASDDPDVIVYGDDVDDAAAFTTTNNDISGRTLTTASTTWQGTAVGTGFKTVDVTTSVQEIISRGGWASGNDLALILDGQSTNVVVIRAYDGTPSEAAKLDITYTSTSVPVLVAHYHQQGMM